MENGLIGRTVEYRNGKNFKTGIVEDKVIYQSCEDNFPVTYYMIFKNKDIKDFGFELVRCDKIIRFTLRNE